MAIDELKLLSGDNYVINDKISIRNPKLKEIKDYGEQSYFSMISNLVAIPSDLKSVLFDIGIDYEEISDFELFIQLSKNFTVNETNIIIGDLDLKNLNVFVNRENDQVFLSEVTNFLDEIMILNGDKLDKFIGDIFDDDGKHQVIDLVNRLKDHEIDLDVFKRIFGDKIFQIKFPKTDGIIIDQHIYLLMSDIIRKMHGFEKKVEHAGTAATKKILIALDREDKELNRRKEFKSMLEPLIVALVNEANFKYDFTTVFDLPLSAFMKSVTQIQKLKNFTFMMQGIYAGNVDVKKINKKELTWIS